MDEKKKMLLADFALLLAATFWGMGFVAGDMPKISDICSYFISW